jgi:hypothetical protein
LEQQGTVWIIQPGEGTALGPPEAPVPPPPPPAPVAEDKPVPPAPAEESGEELSGKDARKKVRDVTKDLKRKYRKQGSQIHRGDLVITENETVHEAVIYGGNLVVNGMSEGDAVTFGGNIEVTGHVGGNAVAIGGNVHLASSAVVDGDATAIGGNVSKEEGATVHGNTASVGSGEAISVNVPKIIGEVMKGSRWGPVTVRRDDDVRLHVGGFIHFLLFFVLTFGLAFLALLLFPERIKRIQTELRTDPLKCGLTGVVGSLAVLAMTILMAVTLIGIPLSILLCIIYFVALVLGIAPVANEIGDRLPWFKGRRTQAGVLAMGTLVLSLVWIVPIMGPLIITLLSMIPLGAIIRTRFGQRSPPSAGPQDPILAQPA